MPQFNRLTLPSSFVAASLVIAVSALPSYANTQVETEDSPSVSITTTTANGSYSIAGSAAIVERKGDNVNRKAPSSKTHTFETQEGPSGSQTLITLKNPSAPRRYVFNFSSTSGARLVRSSSGDISLVAKNGQLLGNIAKPWAFDAQGSKVATRFEVIGGTQLIQTVEPAANAKYPVVADPTVTFGVGYYIHYNRYETEKIYNYSRNGWYAAQVALCGLLPKPANVACAAISASALVRFINVSGEAHNKTCMFMNILPGGIVREVATEKCR